MVHLFAQTAFTTVQYIDIRSHDKGHWQEVPYTQGPCSVEHEDTVLAMQIVLCFGRSLPYVDRQISHPWSKSGVQGVRSGTLYSDPLWRTHRPGLETGVKVHPPARCPSDAAGSQVVHEMVNRWILGETSAKECAINDRATHESGGDPTGMRERAELPPKAVRTTAGDGAALITLC